MDVIDFLLFEYQSTTSVLLSNDDCLYMCRYSQFDPQMDVMKVAEQMSVLFSRQANQDLDEL